MRQLPDSFIEMLKGSGLPETDRLAQSIVSTEPSVAIRINPAKPALLPYDKSPVKWSEGVGFYLNSRPLFTLDPLLHAGAYYVQDPSSMILSHIVRQLTERTGPVTYLDACAAPGGKTTAAISQLPEGSLVVANEYVSSRAAVLKENLIKWGYPDCMVSVGDTSRFKALNDMFDIVATDVPCSGEGMMRKDEEAISQWSMGLVNQCVECQREIIDNLWGAIKPSGWLIYSTCTYNSLEDEGMVRYIVERYGAEICPLTFPEEWGIFVTAEGAHFMPHLLNGEGLFVALLRKPGSERGIAESLKSDKFKEKYKDKIKSKKTQSIGTNLLNEASGWLLNPNDYELSLRENTIVALPKRHLITLSRLESALKIIHSGLYLGEIKGKDLIPTHQAALSILLNPSAFPSIDLTKEDALEYLRKETPRFSRLEGLAKGYVLMKYSGLPLGWIKKLGNRANNLYPKEWRILKRD